MAVIDISSVGDESNPKWEYFRNPLTRFVIGRMEGWKIGGLSSILPFFHPSKVSCHFSGNLKYA
jgi:hypothetical protein